MSVASKSCFSRSVPVDTVNIVRDQMTGRARGFAFVEMQSEEDAQSAIQKLNDTELDGRKLAVNEARPKPTGGGGGDRGGRPGGGGGRGPRREPRWYRASGRAGRLRPQLVSLLQSPWQRGDS